MMSYPVQRKSEILEERPREEAGEKLIYVRVVSTILHASLTYPQ